MARRRPPPTITRYLSPERVAEVHGCTVDEVLDAIDSGELRVSIYIEAAGGELRPGIGQTTASHWRCTTRPGPHLKLRRTRR